MGLIQCSGSYSGADDPATRVSDKGSEDERGDGGKFHQDIDGWTAGVFKRVTNSVTDDGGLMLFRGLAVNLLFEVEVVAFLILNLVGAFFDQLLAVVPGAARVGEGEGDLDAADNDAG